MNNGIRILCAVLAISLELTGCGSSIDVEPSSEKIETTPDNVVYLENFEKQLRKTWIEENWDGGYIFYPTCFTFLITSIQGEKIEGKFSMGMVTYSDVFSGDFTGTIQNGIADCQFDDKSGNKGNMTLGLLENDKMEVSIEFTEKDPMYSTENGTYVFRPYNIKDVEEGGGPFRTRSLAINLIWGKVNIVTVSFIENKPFSLAFLANDNGDILDELCSFPNGMEVKEIILEDINGDGLEDVKFICAAPDLDIISDTEDDCFKYIYVQNEKGFFESFYRLYEE